MASTWVPLPGEVVIGSWPGTARVGTAPAGTELVKPGRAASGVLALVATSIVVLVFYAAPYVVRGFRVPIGNDTAVYVWWARYAQVAGLQAPGIGHRPGIIGALAVISSFLHLPVAWVAPAFGPVLAVCVGLAVAAFVASTFGPDRILMTLTVLFTAIFLVPMVSGYLATLMFGAILVAAFCCLVWRLAESGWWRAVAPGVLVGAAGLAHPIFLGLGAVLIVGGAAPLLTAKSEGGSHRTMQRGSMTRRLVVMALVAGAVFIAGMWLSHASGSPFDTSLDSAYRRLGLSHLLVEAHRSAFIHGSLPWLLALGLAASTVVSVATTPPPTPEGNGTGRRLFFWGVLSAWVLVTAAGLALVFRFDVPGDRLATFSLALPILLAMGFARLLRSDRADVARVSEPLVKARSWTLLAVHVLGIALFLGFQWLLWSTQVPPSPVTITEARSVGTILASEPPGTPAILVADVPGAENLAIDAVNRLRASVPANRTGDVYLYLGSPDDFVARMPSRTGVPGHDRLAQDSWRRIEPLVEGSGPFLAVAIEHFASSAYREALGLRGSTQIAPGVAALPGSTLGADRRPSPEDAALTSPGPAPMSPWLPLWLSPMVLGLLAVVGWPWTRVAWRGGSTLVQVAVAPAVGLAGIALAAVVVDALGIGLGGVGAVVATGGVVATGILAMLLFRKVVALRPPPLSSRRR
jgi:hypothetical protein